MTISNRFALPVSRRRALTTLAALGATPLFSRLALTPVAAAPTSIAKASCVLSPALTEGPYFVDERLNRSDLTTNTTDAGVLQALPLTLKINLVSTTSTACLPLSNVQVDVWHCDALGNYSDVQSQVGQTYLRGYQVSDAAGQVTFKTIYPGWYQGRAGPWSPAGRRCRSSSIRTPAATSTPDPSRSNSRWAPARSRSPRATPHNLPIRFPTVLGAPV